MVDTSLTLHIIYCSPGDCYIAMGYMEIVQQRDAGTLLPIINAHVAPGMVGHTDEWAT